MSMGMCTLYSRDEVDFQASYLTYQASPEL